MKSLVNKLLEQQNDSGKSKILFRLSDIRKVKINKFKIIYMLILLASGPEVLGQFLRLGWSRDG